MKNDIWEHQDVQKNLRFLPPKSRQAYNEFYNKLREGYHPGEIPVPNKTDEFYFDLPTKDRVIYKRNDLGIFIVRIESAAFLWKIRAKIERATFLWKIWAKLNLSLDRIGRLMTLQQILSMLTSFLGIKLF